MCQKMPPQLKVFVKSYGYLPVIVPFCKAKNKPKIKMIIPSVHNIEMAKIAAVEIQKALKQLYLCFYLLCRLYRLSVLQCLR